MTEKLEVLEEHAAGDDTERRLRRAVAILLAEEPHERPGEAA